MTPLDLHPILKGMLRCFRILLEVLASLVGVALLAAAFLIWRLHDQPLSTPALTSYLEVISERLLGEGDVRMTSSLVAWDNVSRSVTLHVDGVKIVDARGVLIASLPSAGVKLNVFGLFLGQVLPTELMVDHLQINLTRDPDGRFFFGEMAADGNATTGSMQPRQILQRITNNLANAAITRRLRISRTVVNVYDSASKSDWAVSIPDIVLQRAPPGLVGEASVEVTQKDLLSTLALYYEYDHRQNTHTLSTRFDGLNPSFFAGGHAETLGIGVASVLDAPVTGEDKISLGQNERVEGAYAALEVGEGKLRQRDLWDGDRALKKASVELEYNYAVGLNARANLNFDGVPIKTEIEGQPDGEALALKASISLKDFPVDRFATLWPKIAIPNARDWIVSNMQKGAFDRCDAEFTLRLPLNELGQTELLSAQGKVEASRVNVTAIPRMPPVTNVSARALFDLAKMDIEILGGKSGNVNLQPFTMKMTGLDQVDQFIDIPLAIRGALPDIIRLIDQPPLGYATAIGLKPDKLTGGVEGIVSLYLPLLKDLAMKDVAVSAQAELANVAAAGIVEGVSISGGALALKVDKGGFSVNGRSLVNTIPVNVVWQDKFNPSVDSYARMVDLDAVISGDQWAQAGLSLLKGSKGNSMVSARLRQRPDAAAKIEISVDMAKAMIRADALSWIKAAGVSATLTAEAELPKKGDIQISSIVLTGRDVAVRGKAVFSQEEKSLVSLQLKPFKIGRNDAEIYITPIKGEQNALHYDIEGKAIDASGLRTVRDEGDVAADTTGLQEFRLNLEQLHTSATSSMRNISGYAVKKSGLWQEADLQGYMAGDTKMSLVIKRNSAGQRSLAIHTDNFGHALEGLGVTNTVRNGVLSVTGVSKANEPQAIEGVIKISEFQVRGLPLLVNLFNATSPFGIGNLLTGTADFDKVRGKFVWRKDSVELTNLRATGSSIGLNADGKVMTDLGVADLRGTVVPFSMINKIISVIPIIGDILTGGGDGVLGVAYSIKGDLNNPKVSVNPASLLTPGFLRNIFFGGDDEGGGQEAGDESRLEKKPEKPPVITNFNKGR